MVNVNGKTYHVDYHTSGVVTWACCLYGRDNTQTLYGKGTTPEAALADLVTEITKADDYINSDIDPFN